MIVVPDSNQFYGDLRMRKPRFRTLLGQHNMGELKLVVPEVVVREVPKLYREQLEQALVKLDGAGKVISELGPKLEIQGVPDLDTSVAGFGEELRNGLAEAAVERPVPEADLMDLVDRAVAEKRPFKGKSQGFRDALIWLTILELAAKDEVAFITKNWKDFAAGDDFALHADLKADLAELDLPEDRVELFPSLDEFIKASVPAAAAVETAQKLMKEDQNWSAHLNMLLEQALQEFEPERWDEVTTIPDTQAELDYVGVRDAMLHGVTIENAYSGLAPDEVLLELRVKAEVGYEFSATPWDAEWLIEERADVDLERLSETLTVVYTGMRPVQIGYFVPFNVKDHEVGKPERIENSAVDLPDDEFWPKKD